ncbi:BTAD domain-containing putative transcriptional regulator [Actinoplanes sp. GCM10030250]|uniref:AfsR/SARP family transcriptional regulator n=1 Tax=Actinoplanes sp. GCM10030250 TaxID=3273376 RepID=UPI00362197C8
MAEVRYTILGPLSVTVDGEPVAVTAGRDRVVLAMLLLNAGRIVGLSEITDAVWGADPPPTVRGQLQTCVSRLRRALPPGVIMTDPAGYGIKVGPEDLDAAVFARLVEQARSTGDVAAARSAYRKGLGLWKGPACAEIDAIAVRHAAAALDEKRVLAVEDWVDLELAAGRAREILGELSEQVQRFPLRERLRGQLMTAMHRAGRQADALAEFRRARETLAEELGIEPGQELQELHRQILAGEPAVTGEAQTAGEAQPAPIRCLPRTVRDFTGRGDLVARLLKEICPDEPLSPAVLVIDGMAGSGKTTLALHLASHVADRYPDAHLFVDLHGHSEQEPIQPADALLVLLRQLGVSAEAIPPDLVGRVGVWRTELARRRTLVVFDNAASSAQVADLLPTAGGSLALVTSRRRLPGLDGVHSESLPLLEVDEAVRLLERIAGDRVHVEPEATAELVRRCGGLPLAVRLAGARLAHRPRWQVADLVHRLGGAALAGLAVENRSVASTFALSYGQLGERAQGLFQRFGLYPGDLLDAPVAAALTGLSLADAQEVLEELLDAHLAEEPEPGVVRLHDLLREFAVTLAGGLDEQERRRAVLEVLDLELRAAVASTTGTYRHSVDRALRDLPPRRPELQSAITDPVARLERQRPALAALQQAAVDTGHPEYGWYLPRAAWYLLFYRGYTGDVASLHERAFAIAEQAGSRTGVAMTANYLASVHFRLADHTRAREYMQIAIRNWTELGEKDALAVALGNLAAIHEASGRFTEAVETAREALRMSGFAGRDTPSAATLIYLATAYGRLGRYPEALAIHRRRLMSAVQHRDVHQLASCFFLIVQLRRRNGSISPEMARRYATAALRLSVQGGFASLEADARNQLAQLHAEAGRTAEAVAEHRRAIETAGNFGDRRYECEFLRDFGTTLLRAGDVPGARELYQRSLSQARRHGLPFCTAQALSGLAECAESTDAGEARRLWSEALVLFEEMGVPERFEVARRLER